MFLRNVRNIMRQLNIYLFSEHLSNADYEWDSGLDIAENHFYKTLLLPPPFSFQQILATNHIYTHTRPHSLSPISKQEEVFVVSC